MIAGNARRGAANARVHLFARYVRFRSPAAWPDSPGRIVHACTPGRYAGAEAQGDDGEPFEEKMRRLAATLRGQQAQAVKLDPAIAANVMELGNGG